MNKIKILNKILLGSKNISFHELRSLAEGFGFELNRINVSHHIFVHPQVPVFLNLQNVKGQAKPYQVRQLLTLVENYNLKLEE